MDMLSDILLRFEKVENDSEDPRFYYVWHKRLFDILLGVLSAALLVWLAVLYMAVSRPDALPWAQTADGRTVALYSVDEPKYTNEAVEEWAETAVKTIYNYDFANYEQQLTRAKPYMAPGAWKTFSEFWNNNLRDKVVEKKIQVNAAVGKAGLVNGVIVAGVATWQIRVPAMISYVAGSASETKKTTFNLTIQRQVSYTNPKGLWITQLIEE
jgi:Type-IV b secretion system, inner-membrane complex component